VTALAAWLDRHTSQAPTALRARVLDRVNATAGGGPAPDLLARAGQRALDLVVDHPGDRSAALDLLAADALITLALLAQAESAPERLGEFATTLLQAGRP
jgi:hypothetical protein